MNYRNSFPFLLIGALSLAGTAPLSAQKAAKKADLEAITHQTAAPAPQATPATPPKSPTLVVSQTAPAGGTRTRLTPAEQLVKSLYDRKVELQAEVDLLGRDLTTARGHKAKKITREIETRASEMALIDRKLEAMPKSALAVLPGYAAAPAGESTAPQEAVERPGEPPIVICEADPPVTRQIVASTPTYHVQIAALSQPVNLFRFADLGREMVQELKVSDRLWIYYYGSYPSYAEASNAAQTLRKKPDYKDAFVIAVQNGARVPITK